MSDLGICYCGAYGGGKHTTSARCDGSREQSFGVADVSKRGPEHWLGELLAVIHCDGGHYQAQHGDEKAVKDAIDKWNNLARCPHGMPLAENICGPCSHGRPNRRAAT